MDTIWVAFSIHTQLIQHNYMDTILLAGGIQGRQLWNLWNLGGWGVTIRRLQLVAIILHLDLVAIIHHQHRWWCWWLFIAARSR